VATPLVALHIRPDGESLSTTGMRAVEWFLASVRVRVDAQTRGSGEGLVAGTADISVVVLLVRGCVGGGEVMVVLVLPSGSDGGDEGGRLLGWCGLLWDCWRGNGGGVDCGWVEGCVAWGAGVVEGRVVGRVGFHGRGIG
jgi:hypothetical protein